MTLGERDSYDMGENEFWLLLAGVKPPEDSILKAKLTETFLQGLTGRARGVVLKVTKGEEVREDILRGMRRSLTGVKDGELTIV